MGYPPMKGFRNVKGELVLEKIPISKIAEKKVIKNNASSGKVLLPKNMIGKKVYILLR